MASDVRVRFQKNLNRLMKERDVKQVDLQKALKVTSAATSAWCNGVKVPRMDMIEKIADFLRVTSADLLRDEGDEYYYHSLETRELADAISKDDELKMLFRAARDITPEELKALHTLIKSMRRKELNEEE